MKRKGEEKILTKILSLYPEFYKIYGPYKRKDKRKFIILCDGQKRSARQWARVKLEVKLGRRLTEKETVDHKDGNVNNDNLSNLQILSREENSSKSVKKIIKRASKCAFCLKVFQLTRNQINNRSQSKKGPFCSKFCRGRGSWLGLVSSRKIEYSN